MIPGGDVIVSVDGRQVEEPNALASAIARLSPGQTVPVVLFRDGKKRTVQVKLAKRPEDAG